MKKIILLMLLLISCNSNTAVNTLNDELFADIATSKGIISISLYYLETPMTVTNFVGLAQGKIKNTAKDLGVPFYDGLTFNMAEEGYVIQGGDPEGTGMGGPGYEFPNEISALLDFKEAGMVGMAHKGLDTNGSQFFITLDSIPEITGNYSIFGKITEGLDIAKTIAIDDVINSITFRATSPSAQKFLNSISDDSFKKSIKDFRAKKEKLAQENLNKQKDLIAKNKAWTTDKVVDGIKYKIIKEGTGKEVSDAAIINFHFTINLPDGTEIISSIVENPEGVLGQVGNEQMLPGWNALFKGMKMGEQRLAVLSYDQAFGEYGEPDIIPPYSYVIYTLELLNVQSEEEYTLIETNKINSIKEQQLKTIKETPAFATDKTSENGIMYKIITAGTTKPAQGTTVKVHYTGKLADGTVFDSSIENGEPISLVIGAEQVIPGWVQMIRDMNFGEKRFVIIPPELAYGGENLGIIPPYSYLIFEIELLK